MPFLPQAFVLGSSMPFLPQAFVLGSFYAFFATARVCIGWRKGAGGGGGVLTSRGPCH